MSYQRINLLPTYLFKLECFLEAFLFFYLNIDTTFLNFKLLYDFLANWIFL